MRPSNPGVDAIATASAVQLFVRRAQQVRPDFELTEDNVTSPRSRRLDGPRWRSSWRRQRLRILAPADLLEQLEHRLDTLSGSSRASRSSPHVSRRSWSHDLLTEDERACSGGSACSPAVRFIRSR
jgi:predicted ATPase